MVRWLFVVGKTALPPLLVSLPLALPVSLGPCGILLAQLHPVAWMLRAPLLRAVQALFLSHGPYFSQFWRGVLLSRPRLPGGLFTLQFPVPRLLFSQIWKGR